MTLTAKSDPASALRPVVLAASMVPAAWVALDYATGQLGARPVKQALLEIGLWAVRLLVLSLAVTPLRRALRWPRLATVRRRVGVAAFCYAALHFTLYVADQKFDLALVASEIALRLYLTIGFTALLGLAALAATSTDAMTRRMGGRRWRRLHLLSFPIAVLAILHFFLQTRLEAAEPTFLAGCLLWLLAFRIAARRGDPSPATLFALGLGAGAATMAAEAAAIWFKFGASPLRVLAAGFTFEMGVRPGMAVLTIGLGVAAAAWARAPARGPLGSVA